MPQRQHIDNFKRITRRKVYVREGGRFNIEHNMDGPVGTRSLEQVMRDNRIANALINQAKRAELQRKKVEQHLAIENEQQRRREQEAEALQQKIREGVAVQTAAANRRANAIVMKTREKHVKLSHQLTREKKNLHFKIDKIKRYYAGRLSHINRDLVDARRPAKELQKKWTGKHDSELEFNGIQKHGVYHIWKILFILHSF